MNSWIAGSTEVRFTMSILNKEDLSDIENGMMGQCYLLHPSVCICSDFPTTSGTKQWRHRADATEQGGMTATEGLPARQGESMISPT